MGLLNSLKSELRSLHWASDTYCSRHCRFQEYFLIFQCSSSLQLSLCKYRMWEWYSPLISGFFFLLKPPDSSASCVQHLLWRPGLPATTVIKTKNDQTWDVWKAHKAPLHLQFSMPGASSVTDLIHIPFVRLQSHRGLEAAEGLVGLVTI